MCGKLLWRRDSLKRHMDEVHSGKRTREVYSCTKCGKRYTKKKVLKKHIAAAHSAARWVNLAIYKKYMTTIRERSRIVCRLCAIKEANLCL